MGGKFAVLCILDSNVDTIAQRLKEVLLSTAEEIRGKQRKKIQPWVTNKVLDLVQSETVEVHKLKLEVGLEYRKVYREVEKKMKTAKEEWIDLSSSAKTWRKE